MTIIVSTTKSCLITTLVTLLQSSVIVNANYHQMHSYQQGGSYVQFDSCACATSDLLVGGKDGTTAADFCTPTVNQAGSQARTWANLCAGSRGNVATFDDDTDNVNENGDTGNNEFFTIKQRVGDPFRRLCLLIGQYPNVRDYLGRGYSPHTIFAPTDSAFSKVDGIVGQIDEQKLIEIHILPEARLTYDLHCGKTYRTLNTDNLQKRNQKTKTKCITGGITEQLGPGNYKAGHKPRIGYPRNIFNAWQFQGQDSFRNLLTDTEDGLEATEGDEDTGYNYLFSDDIISCNGIIHVVDNVILPGSTGFGGIDGFGGGAVGSGYYGGGYGSGSTWRSHGGGHSGGYYGGGVGKGGISSGHSGGYYGSGRHRSSSGIHHSNGGYYGGGGRGKGGIVSGGQHHSGYYGSRPIGKGSRPIGKGISYGGYGRYGHKGAKGYGHKGAKHYGGYYGYGHKGAKGHRRRGIGNGMGIGKGVGKGIGGGSRHGGYYRRDLEHDEEGDYAAADDYDDEDAEEYIDFLSPDFEESARYGYDADEDEEDYDYEDDGDDDDDDDEDSVYFGQQIATDAINAINNDMEDKSKASAAATAEKYKKRKQRLELLMEPNGEMASVTQEE